MTLPLITFDEARRVGEALHDRWAKQRGSAPPFMRADFAWGDIVQSVLAEARGVIAARGSTDDTVDEAPESDSQTSRSPQRRTLAEIADDVQGKADG